MVSDDVHVTVPPGDDRYLTAIALAGPESAVQVHHRGESYPSEYHATHRVWSTEDRTILLLGDTFFTDEAIAKIDAFSERKYQGFGRKGASRFTGCRYGELWAASWWPEQIPQMDTYLAQIKRLREEGTITRPTGWMLLRAWQGIPLNKHRCEPEWMTTIDDLTDDFDFPLDYHRHPVTRKETQRMEAGKGHAARNPQLPALLERLGVEPRHVVHVGAHDGEEMPYYEAAKFERITLVEPLPDKAAALRAKWPYVEVVEAAVASKGSAKGELRVMPTTNMSTLVQGGPDAHARTIEVKVVRLKDIAKTANVAVVDVQGLELDVLQGADLSRYDVVMVETTTVPDATMASTYDDVTAFMCAAGFDVVEYWTRDYQWVAKWGRKRNHAQRGEVRDVVYAKRPKEDDAARALQDAVNASIASRQELETHPDPGYVDTAPVLQDAHGFDGYEDVKLDTAE